MKVLGADIGSRNVKLYWGTGASCFDSTLCHATELKMGIGNGDMIVEYEGIKYFVGPLAVREGIAPISPKGMDKVHEYTAIRLFAGMIYNKIYHVGKLTISQPIENCNKTNGDKMRNMLAGTHHINMNDNVYEIKIDTVEVAPEGAIAYYSLNTRPSHAYVVDLGSGTVNLAAMNGGRFVNNMSSTLNFGNETNKKPSYEKMAQVIHSHTKAHWNPSYPVYVCGGVASKLAPALEKYFEDVHIMPNPLYANVTGLYRMGCRVNA